MWEYMLLANLAVSTGANQHGHLSRENGLTKPRLIEHLETQINEVGDGLSWWIVLLITLSIVVIIFVIVKCCVQLQDVSMRHVRKICYLCLEKVPEMAWKNGTHRRQCAFRNAMKLNNLLQHDTVRCPTCNLKLRLWSDQPAPGFVCDSDGYSKSLSCLTKLKPMQSNGKNRYNCFLCDYDLCEPCLERQADINQKSVECPLEDVSRKSSVEFSQQVSRELLQKPDKDDFLSLHFPSNTNLRHSKETVTGISRRESYDSAHKKEQSRRASHVGFIKIRSRRSSDEQNGVNLHPKYPRRTCRDSNQKLNQKLNSRRKSHADILEVGSNRQRSALALPTHSNRRYSQIEVQELKAFQHKVLEEQQFGQDDHIKSHNHGHDQNYNQKYGHIHSHVNGHGHIHDKNHQNLSNVHDHEHSSMNGYDHKHTHDPNNPQCSKTNHSINNHTNYHNIHNNHSKQSKSSNSRRGSEQLHNNLQVREHDDDVENRVQGKEVSGLLIGAELLNPLDKHPRNIYHRRASLRPLEMESISVPVSQRRRNSSTVLILSVQNDSGDESPMFINKEDGLV